MQLLTIITCLSSVAGLSYSCTDIQKIYSDNNCCPGKLTSSNWTCSIPDIETANWGVDATYSLEPSKFVRLHNTIATVTPFELGNESALQHNIGRDLGNVLLNRYVGASHAMCFALNVKGFEDKFNFRVCTSVEVLALTAVIPMSSNQHILTYASSDGDDYETGELKHTFNVDNTKPSAYSYDNDSDSPTPLESASTNPPESPSPNLPPPPSPNPPMQHMQSFMGSDNEVNLGKIDSHLNVVAYCCSGVYTHMTGEGPSR